MSRRFAPHSLALMLIPIALLSASTAFGHPGHAGGDQSGFASGLLHPLLGLDHLLAIAAVGVWSIRQDKLLHRFTPLVLLMGMWGGALLAWGGIPLPGVETGIALTVLLAGVLIATLAKLPGLWGGGVVMTFMLFHGHAHGSELPVGASMLSYLAGFTLATLTIALTGKCLGAWLQRHEVRWVRGLGSAIAAAGSLFVLN